jgi:carboxypeptidase family protein
MHGRTWLYMLLMLFTSACGRDRTPTPTSPSPASVSQVRLMSVRITGPTSVAPGSTAEYAAIAEYSDGSTKDVTADASWTPNNRAEFPLYFTSAGIAAAVKYGEQVIGAAYHPTGGHREADSRTVFVLDPGTFKLGGTVLDSRGGVIADAAVEVLSGTGKGLKAITDLEGRYVLFGVAGPIRLRTSAVGFSEDVRDVDVMQNVVAPLALTPLADPADVSGSWTLTVTPSSGCPAGLPDVAQNRIYEMRFSQQAMNLQWTLSSETLENGIARSWTFGNTVVGSRVRLLFAGATDDLEIIDRVSPTEWLGFFGSVAATVSGSEIRGTLNGSLVYWTRAYSGIWHCTTTDHIVTLRR